MMRKVGLEKYTVFLLVCFFSLIATIFADETERPVRTVNVPSLYYGSVYAIPNSDYENLVCKSDGLVALSVTQNGAGYNVTLKSEMTEDGVETVVCDYDRKVAVGIEESTPGTIKYKVNYKAGKEKNHEYFLGFGIEYVDMIAQLDATKIVDYSFESTSGREYISMSQCPNDSTTCKVTVADAVSDLDPSQNYVVWVSFKYKVAGDDKDHTTKVKFNINAFQGAFAWDNWSDDNPLGYCNYSSDWEQASTTRSNGHKFYYYRTANTSAHLPTCTPNKNAVVPIVFKGWIAGVEGDTAISKATSIGYENTSNLYAVGTCPAGLPMGGSGDENIVAAHTNYAPCYEADTSYVRLSLSTGKVEDSNWTVSENSKYEYYHLGDSAEDTVALPDVVYSGSFSEAKSLQCWENQTTGACVDPGTVVKTDGTIYVAVTDVLHEEYSYFKSVKVNDAVVFAVEGMKGCSIASGQPSGYISVSSYNGDCLVTGIKVTDPLGIDGPEYIEVEIPLENGSKKIYKFSVESNTGIDAAGNGEFIVNPNVNSGEENSYTDSSGFQTSTCSSFWITPGSYADIGGGLRSNTYNVSPECDGDDNNYIALCLDPGREAPENGEHYEKVYDIKPNTDFGKLITYLVENPDIGIEEFDNVNSPKRIAAHIAVRIVAIQSGMGATSGIAYGGHHAPYQAVADAIESQNPTTAGEYAQIIKDKMGINDEYANLAGTYLAEYKTNVDDTEAHGFERTIDYSGTEVYGNGYIVTYRGTITAPANASNVKLNEPADINGVKFKVVNWDEASKSETGRTTYDYEVKITAENTLAVIPPTSDEDKMLMSFRITYEGGKTTSNVFLAQPVGTAGALQRMIIFDTDSNDLYIYFNVAPNDCELPGLNYKECLSATECDGFNKKLFKASGCCRYVTDQMTYKYVINSVCAAECTTSTMSNVCDYTTADKNAELYEIKEGSEYDGSKTGEGSGYANAIGTCIVNVEEDIRNADKDNFEKKDDNGNSISVKSYESNTYCRINCKEDWQLSMDAFGSFVGEKAVAAGSYFQIENDLFIGGKRTCYTNYIDYDAYMNDLVVISQSIVSSYNSYSNLSHSWSDIDKQTGPDDGGFSHSSTDSTYKVSYSVVSSCPDDDPETEDVDESLGECSLSVVETGRDVIETYYGYTLKVNHEYEGVGNDTTGNHREFTTDPFDPQGTVSEGSKETQTKLADETGALNQYNVPDDVMSINIDRHDPPGTGACTPPRGGSCDAGTFEDVYEDTITSYTGLTVGPYTDDNPDRDGAFSVLKEEMLEKLEADMAGPRGGVGGGAARIRKLIDEMYECQHFQLVNTTDDNNDYEPTERLSGKYYNTTRPYTEITTAFDPDVTYEYAEDAFMTILLNNKENYLEPYDEKNDGYYGGNEGDYKKATNKTEIADIKLSSSETEQVNLARNYLQFTYYKDNDTWDAESETGRNYDNGNGSPTIQTGVTDSTFSAGEPGYYKTKSITLCGISCGGKSTYVSTTNSKGVTSGAYVCNDDPKWDGGACFDTIAPYLEANYIQASIENSSFYKNQGSWFVNIQDVKAHGEGLENALRNENSNNNAGYKISEELVSERWTPIGLMNVFPISITTPRNLYTYTYTFKDIGSHSGGDLGRLMGDDNAIISNNNRTCFYEVYEELCLCCGDEINTYTFNDPDENDLIKQVMAQSGYQESNYDDIKSNEGGTLAFATSSVNLSDVDVDPTKRPTASNWSNNSPFIYGGEYNLSTSKGEQLKNAIESQGETIYSTNSGSGGAEYAYYLTPTTLTEIREYNDAHGYELNFNNLKVYGRYSIAALEGCSNPESESCWVPSSDATELFNNEIINFQHYGSVFLEELAKDSSITKSSTLAREDNDKVCLVVDGNFDAAKINELVKGGCRWIDYVENLAGNTNGNTEYVYPFTEGTSSEQKVTYFRLAFK